MRVLLVTKTIKFMHIEMFNAMENTRKLLLVTVICSKTKSTAVEIVHCRRFLVLTALLMSLKGAPIWPPHAFSLKCSHLY